MQKYDISERATGSAWAKVLDASIFRRTGRLVGSSVIRTEVAFDDDGTGAVVVPPAGVDFTLEANVELWARVEGGGEGPSELFGQLVEVWRPFAVE